MKDHESVLLALTVQVKQTDNLKLLSVWITLLVEFDTGTNKINRKQNFQNANNFQNRANRGRFNKQQKWKPRSKTVHINPHFKGDVQINGSGKSFLAE